MGRNEGVNGGSSSCIWMWPAGCARWMDVLFHVSVRSSGSASSSTWWAAAHKETGNLRRAHSAGPLPAHRRYTHQLLQEQRVSQTHTHTNTHTRWWTPFLTLSCFCRSNELIQRALMDNDFMKHLEHGQVMTPLSSSSVSYVWFKKNKQTHLSAHVCRSSPSWTVCIPPA